MYMVFSATQGNVEIQGNPVVALVLISAVFIYVLIQALNMPQVITWTDDNKIKLISILKTHVISPTDIESIKPSWYLLAIKWNEGKVKIDHNFNGLSELVSLIKQNNNKVEIKGV